MRDQVYKELELPPSNTIVQVFLFEDKEHYERFMQLKHPDLPKRRAFFVAQPRRLGGNEDLLVYTYWGDRIQQDLRHELTHALLHCVLKDVPLWLDEGLAEFFEVPPGWNGVNAQHVEQLRGKNKFDLDRLEQLTDVQQMNPAEYREAWAWTHLMLRSTPPGPPGTGQLISRNYASIPIPAPCGRAWKRSSSASMPPSNAIWPASANPAPTSRM